MEPMLILLHILLLLILGLVSFIFSKFLNIPRLFLFLLSGIFLGSINYYGEQLISLPQLFILSLATIAVIIYAFDSVAKLKLKELDTVARRGLRIYIAVFALNIIFLSVITFTVFKMENAFFAVLFAVLMSAAGIGMIKRLDEKKHYRIKELLMHESGVGTPFTIAMFFIVLPMLVITIASSNSETIMSLFSELFMHILIGAAIGFSIALIVFNIMKKYYSKVYSPIVLIASCIASYFFAEIMAGSGATAVIMLALIYANTYVKEKKAIITVSDKIVFYLLIAVFIVLGIVIKIPLSTDFFLTSLFIFAIILVIRLFAVFIALFRLGYSTGEKVYVALSAPVSPFAGIAVLFLSGIMISENIKLFSIHEAAVISQLIVAVLVYSFVLHFTVHKLTPYFLKAESEKDIEKNTEKVIEKGMEKNIEKDTDTEKDTEKDTERDMKKDIEKKFKKKSVNKKKVTKK